MVIGPAADGADGDVEVVQTYASGPASQVNSIIWPNPEFDNDVTVWGPEVKALVERYLVQMMGELHELPHPDDPELALVDAIDLVVPHQANRTMVVELAGAGGDRRGAASTSTSTRSATSRPRASRSRSGTPWPRESSTGAMRIFAPGFGAGAVAGYAVLWIDPAILVPEGERHPGDGRRQAHDGRAHTTTVDDVREAFN